MSKSKKFFPPFRIGDVVLYKNEEHIIENVSLYGVNEYEYATNRSAWHNHRECKLVRPADMDSITQLIADKSV